MEFQFFGKFKISEETECPIKTIKTKYFTNRKISEETECPIKIPMYQKPNISQIFLELLPESFRKKFSHSQPGWSKVGISSKVQYF